VKHSLALILLIAAPVLGTTALDASGSKAAGRGGALLRNSVLSSHNGTRQMFGVAPLAWSDALAAEAMRHAQYMAQTGVYGHDRTPGRRKKMGENIWRGQRDAFSYEVMVGTMTAESRNFRPGAYPNVSQTGDWSQVSHFTQIIWPTTTEVGCALASSQSTDYFVCRYAPAGNKDGVYLERARGPIPAHPDIRRSAERGD